MRILILVFNWISLHTFLNKTIIIYYIDYPYPLRYQGIKILSDWPTFPQVYVDGELIGGLDIIKEAIANGYSLLHQDSKYLVIVKI